MNIVDFTGLVVTMWIRAIFAILLIYSAALMVSVATAQPLAGDRPLYGYGTQKPQKSQKPQKPHKRLEVLNVVREAPEFGRPARSNGLIITAQITKAQAVRAAIRCNRGGEALKPPVRSGRGFVVKVLKGSYVRNIRVDRNGRCG